MTQLVLPLLLAIGAGGLQTVDLQAELAGLVDLPTARGRSKAAALLARKDVDINVWLGAMADFGHFGSAPSGLVTETALLVVQGETRSRELDIYVPSSYAPDQPAPLMLMFHGTGTGAEGVSSFWHKTADELGMLVVAPSDPSAVQGYAFSSSERDEALAALRWTRRSFNVDENRIYASGISRGGHLAWDLALRHPGTFAAIAPLIGGPRIQLAAGQNNLRYIENVRDLAIRDLQGARDDAGLVFNLRLAFERLGQLGAKDTRLVEFPELGHWFDFKAVDWTAFLSWTWRQPTPKGVVRCFARAGEGRAFWLDVEAAGSEIEEVFTPTLRSSQAKKITTDVDKRRFLVEQADEHTARIELEQVRRGTFTGSARGIERFRILFSADMLPASHKVEVELNGRSYNRRVRVDNGVLLADFAERFDRTFLPVGQAVIKM